MNTNNKCEEKWEIASIATNSFEKANLLRVHTISKDSNTVATLINTVSGKIINLGIHEIFERIQNGKLEVCNIEVGEQYIKITETNADYIIPDNDMIVAIRTNGIRKKLRFIVTDKLDRSVRKLSLLGYNIDYDSNNNKLITSNGESVFIRNIKDTVVLSDKDNIIVVSTKRIKLIDTVSYGVNYNIFKGTYYSSIDLSETCMNNLHNLGYSFSFLVTTKLTLPNIILDNTINLESMFYYSNIEKLDLSKITNTDTEFIEPMFRDCKISEIDLRNFEFRGDIVSHINTITKYSESKHIIINKAFEHIIRGSRDINENIKISYI